MNIDTELNALIAKREEVEGEIDDETNPVIAEIIELMTRDISNTISFLINECSEEQFI